MARPLQYVPDEFNDKVVEYFHTLPSGMIPCKSGLLLHLDLSRQAWSEYKKREGFGDTIKRAELSIETSWVARLNSNAPTGAIFYLKNAFKEEYRDRHETDITSGGEKIIPIYVSGNKRLKENIEVKEEN